jgi:hypothetical protein
VCPGAGGAVCGSECTRRLEDEDSVRVALAVKRNIIGYQNRRDGRIDARSEPVVAETGAFPATSPKVVGAAIGVPPPSVPAAGGPAGGVMLRNAALSAALIAVEVVVSGYRFVMTFPLIVGGMPPQGPKPPALSTVTALHVWLGSNTTFPLI